MGFWRRSPVPPLARRQSYHPNDIAMSFLGGNNARVENKEEICTDQPDIYDLGTSLHSHPSVRNSPWVDKIYNV